MMQAAIFDMDGTLIDSEPMWKEAEKQVFSSVGVEVGVNKIKTRQDSIQQSCILNILHITLV